MNSDLNIFQLRNCSTLKFLTSMFINDQWPSIFIQFAFAFLLQWSFNMGTTMDHSMHWYYCYCCLGDPSGHIEISWTFSDFEIFDFSDFNFWNFIMEFLLQWSFNTMGHSMLPIRCEHIRRGTYGGKVPLSMSLVITETWFMSCDTGWSKVQTPPPGPRLKMHRENWV